MSESVPTSVGTPVPKGMAVAVFVINTLTILGVGALSGVVLTKTARLSVANVGHLVQTKGKIWEDSKYRHLEIAVQD